MSEHRKRERGVNIIITLLPPTLALIWQLMRAYTLSILSRLANTGNPIIEKEIVMWVNNKLASAGKTTSTKSFQDSAIKDGKIVIDLIDSIKKGSINYDLVRTGGTEEVSSLRNCLIRRETNLGICRIIWRMPSTPFRWPARSVLEFTHFRRT